MNLFRLLFPQKDPQYIKHTYKIPDTISWKIVLNNKGLVATSEELPGLVTNANDPEELLEIINDAVLEYFDVPKIESDYIFDKLNIQGQGTVLLRQVKNKNSMPRLLVTTSRNNNV